MANVFTVADFEAGGRLHQPQPAKSSKFMIRISAAIHRQLEIAQVELKKENQAIARNAKIPHSRENHRYWARLKRRGRLLIRIVLRVIIEGRVAVLRILTFFPGFFANLASVTSLFEE